LGATPRRSTLDLARRRARGADPFHRPDQDDRPRRAPGAFVGAIFGGLSPLEAGRFQIIVLAAIMAAGAVTAVLVATWLGPMRTKPVIAV
jgi:putative ABC transport system permease protein